MSTFDFIFKRPIAAFFLLFTIWILTHPYLGIWHDASLYTAQALSHLNPTAFRKDLFFAYGSQDSFTLFSPLYAYLINAIGINLAAIYLLSLFHLIWFSSCWLLYRRFLHGKWLWLALIMTFGMSRYYGGGDTLSYSEGFITARIAGEAFALAGIAAYFWGFQKTGILLAFIGTSFHPLIAGWGLAIIILSHCNWRFILAAVVLSLIFLFISPTLLNTFLRPIDDEWRTLVVATSPYIFMDQWSIKDLSRACMILSFVIVAFNVSTEKKLWGSLLVATLAGLGASWLGASIFHNALITQLQLWRVLWIASVLQWFAIACISQKLWPDTKKRIWLIWLGIFWMFQDLFGGFLGVAGALSFYIARDITFSKDAFKRIKTITWVTFVVALLSWIPNAYMDAWVEGGNYLRNETPLSQIISGFLLTNTFIVLGLILWWLAQQEKPSHRAALSITLTILLSYGVLNWDQRPPLRKFIETTAALPQNRPFADQIKPGDMVYSQNIINSTWLGLKTSHYASNKQVSGIVFHKETAIEARRRLTRVSLMALPLDELAKEGESAIHRELSKMGLDDMDELRRKETLNVTFSGLVHLCHDPILDFVVVGTLFPGLVIDEYRIPLGNLRYRLYDCKSIRERFADPLPSGYKFNGT